MITFSSFDSTFIFKTDILVCEIIRETDQKNDRPCTEPVSQQNKFISALFSTLIDCANEAAVTD